MAMVVKNNMTAINTLNTLNKNSSALSKSLQKVSSGMKINSAADDASGYAISERMRVQIRSLDQANQNTQNGSSMMKVAEGAVSSTVEILKTLKEKAVNAANDSNTDSDRQTIQKELDQSIDQINDNANVTFNGKYLVDGSKNSKGNATYTVLTNQSLSEDTTGSTKLTELKARSGDSLEIVDTDKVTVSYVQAGVTKSVTFDAKDATLKDIFTKAEDIDTTTQLFADVKGNSSVQASLDLKSSEVAAKATAAGTALTTAKTNLDTASGKKNAYDSAKAKNDAANAIMGTLNTGNPANSTGAVKAAYDAVVEWNKVAAPANQIDIATVFVTDVKTTSTNLKGTDGLDKVKADAAYTSDVGIAVTAAIDALDKAYTAVGNGTDAGTLKDYNTANTAYDATAKTAYVNAKAAYDNAKATFDIYNGVAVVSSDKVGVDAAGDMVTTASGKKGISITANTAGIGGQISGLNISITDSKGNVKKSANAALDAFEETIRAQNESQDNTISLQVGAKANQSIKVGLTDMRAEALGLKGADGTTLNISTQTKANAAINVLDNAIQKALDQQTTIGSVESRLEYTSSNLTTASENVQASESTIRDADMAKEMTNYTKNNVLLQAAQSMLAQANQSSSNVLSLLQ
ncbi:MAG: hypothetical protein MR545_05275 [Veillonellaceae bacterium]|nr:hypothetical protein [Veillonellaceae bacterium]